MGLITAQSMHEMQNILAIIHESAGLLGDILKVNAKVDFKHRPKMESTLGHIFSQVHRGKSLLHATSRLAHAPDDDLLESCDLAVYSTIGVQLSERMARLRGSEVAFTPPTEAQPVRTGALNVLMSVYHGLYWATSGPTHNQAVAVTVAKAGSDRIVRVTAPAAAAPDVAALDHPRLLLGPDRVVLQGRELNLVFPALT